MEIKMDISKIMIKKRITKMKRQRKRERLRKSERRGSIGIEGE